MKKYIMGILMLTVSLFSTIQVMAFQAPTKASLLPLSEVLTLLEKHYNINFLYEEVNIHLKKVSFDNNTLKNENAEQTLKRILTPQGLSWSKIDDKNYAIYPIGSAKRSNDSKNLSEQVITDSLSSGKITGQILNTEGNPEEYVTISLLQASNSTLVQRTLTNKQGYYLFSVKAGTYLVRADLMGYSPAFSAPVVSNSAAEIKLSAIRLEGYSNTLKEVQIISSKPLVEVKSDRFIINVENSAMALGNSIQLLKSAPFVSVSADNSISLQGKKTMILIDNKPVSEFSLPYILQAMPAGNISKMELITNPSAKYDAAYGAVINITTRKNQIEGVTTTISTEVSTGLYNRGNLNGALAYKHKSLTLYGNVNYYKADDMFANTAERTLRAETIPDILSYNWKRLAHNNIYSYQTGAEFVLDKNQTLGAVIDGVIYRSKGPWATIDKFSKQGLPTDSILNTNTTFDLDLSTKNYNINYHLLSDSGKNELTALATYMPFQRDLFQNFPSVLTAPEGNVIRTPKTYQTRNISNINVYLAQIDYTHQFDKQWKLEAGSKYQYSHSRNSIDYKRDNDGMMEQIPQFSSNNELKETIIGSYGILSKNWKDDKLQVGLRVENTSATFIGNFSKDYFNTFPTFLYQHTINDNYNYSFSYKKTITRAPYSDLVPYTVFVNQYTVEEGNPRLKPSYDHIFSVNTNIKKLNLSLMYTSTQGMFFLLPSRQDYKTKVSYASRQNLDRSYDLSMYLFYPFRINSWWETQNSGTVIGYNKATGQVLNSSYSLSAYHSDFKSSHTFKLNNTIKLQLDAYYWSSYVQGLTHFSGYKNADAAVLFDLFSGKGQLRVAGNELIFKRNDYRQHNDFGAYSAKDMIQTDSKRATIAFSYKIGSTKIKSPDKKLGNDEATRRL